MNRIYKAFENKKAFIGFLTAGDPVIDKTVDYILDMEEAGASLIEIGIPFSDPIAEGPTIQEANVRALKNKVTTDDVFEMVKKVREKSDIPLCFMTYLNVVFHYGYDEFFKKCQEVGIDGIILPDLPYEESQEVKDVCYNYDVTLISMIAPTSKDRVEMIAKEAKGFIYLVSSMGVTGTRDKVQNKMATLHVADAMTEVFALFKRCNKYIDETMPWALAKDESKKERLEEVLYNLVESITIGANLLKAFMPNTTESILKQLYPDNPAAGDRDFDDLDKFGLRESGNKVTDKPEILFARLDIEEVMKKVEELQEAQRKANGVPEYPVVEKKPEITFDDFEKIQIQVGEVLKCEPVKKAKKLLCSQIRIGEEVRQIVSGISQYYKPEEMVGKKVAVVTNLAPRKICGVESQGMILAAMDDKNNLSVMTVDKDIIAGSEIG